MCQLPGEFTRHAGLVFDAPSFVKRRQPGGACRRRAGSLAAARSLDANEIHAVREVTHARFFEMEDRTVEDVEAE